MKTVFTFLLSESVLIPIIASFFVLKKLTSCWLPFFCMLLLALAAEVVSFYYIEHLKISNAPVIKIYSLCECCLIIYQFYILQNKRFHTFYTVLIISCTVFWLAENVALKNLFNFSPYFRVLYAFIIVLLSINLINLLMVNQRNALLKSPVFMLSLAFIIFFIYQIIYEASFFIGSGKYAVANRIIMLFAYINVIVNLMYAAVIGLIAKNDDMACHKKQSNF